MPEKIRKEFIKDTVKVGNSAGVILPKRLLGSKVKVRVLKKPLNLKKEVLEKLKNDFKEIRGIFLMRKKPVEVLVITDKIKKIIKKDFKITLIPFSTVQKDIKNKKEVRARIMRAEAMMNKALLEKLKKDIRKAR